MTIRRLPFLLALLWLGAVWGGSAAPPHVSDEEAWVDSVLAHLSLDEKIGQLMIVHLPARGRERIRLDAARRMVRERHVGGFLVGRLLPPDRVREATRALQREARLPLFFAADYERGVGRFDNAFTELPSNMALGATRDTALAAAAGRVTARESRAVGVNLLLAPVVDVNDNPANPIINVRSYGEDPALVAAMARAFVRGAESGGVLTTLKHFPGHGNTSVDSHNRMGRVAGSIAALTATELRPFAAVLSAETPAAVMTAHLWVPALDPDPLPATFSRRVLTGLLREEMGFQGLILTDDVRMGALHDSYPLAERVVRPLEAGADLILTPDDLGQAITAIRAAQLSGRITEARLDASVRRILRARYRLLTALPKPPAHGGANVASRIAGAAVTLLKGAPGLPEEKTVGLLQLSNYRGSESIAAAMDRMAAHLAPRLAAEVRIDDRVKARQGARLVEKVTRADVVVLALYQRLRAGRDRAGLLEGQGALIERVLASGRPVVLITFGNPYVVSRFRDAGVVLVAYDQTIATADAVASVLRGERDAPGRLPVTATPYPFGAGRGGWTGTPAR